MIIKEINYPVDKLDTWSRPLFQKLCLSRFFNVEILKNLIAIRFEKFGTCSIFETYFPIWLKQDKTMIYRQQRIYKKLPSCSLGFADIISLIELFSSFHEECAVKMITDIREGSFSCQPITQESHLDKIKIFVETNFVATLEVFGSNGEYLNVDLKDVSTLRGFDIPHKVIKVKIGNSSVFEIINKKKPSVYVDLSLDFNEVKVFDLVSHASASTVNDSFYDVTGIDSTFVNGISSRLISFINKFRNFNYLINEQHAYDVLLWIIFFPLLIFYILKYQQIFIIISSKPTFIQVFLSILLLLLSLLVFRCIFNVARWLFPCQEIKDQVRKIKKTTKYVYSIAATGVIGTIAYNIIHSFYDSIAK